MPRSKETTLLPGLEKLATELKSRCDINLNQQATEIGIDRSSYQNLVYRRKSASLAVARDIARYFCVPIETLLEPAPEKINA